MRLESAASNEERARIIAAGLVLDRRHLPVAHRLAVEERLEAGIGRERRRRDDEVAGSARHGDAREHRVG